MTMNSSGATFVSHSFGFIIFCIIFLKFSRLFYKSCSGTQQQNFPTGSVSHGLLHKDPNFDRTKVELWLAQLVTNVQDQVRIPGFIVRFFTQFLTGKKAT